MNKKLKIYFILFYFTLFYFIFMLDEMYRYSENIKLFLNIFILLEIIVLVWLGYLLKKNKVLYLSIIIRIILFTSFLLFYFMIEQGILKIVIYGIGDSGGLIRHNFIKDSFHQFKWSEILYWNFIFSLHYPIYIFIFFKPFVNHLDKSIRKIKGKKLKNLKLIKTVIDNRPSKKK